MNNRAIHLWVILAIVLWLLVVWLGRATAVPTPIHHTYLPMVAHTAVGCPECGRGIAWLSGGCGRLHHLDLLEARYFYDSGTYNCADAPGAIIMVRPNSSNPPRYSQVLAALPGYDGVMLVGNEFDRPDQDNFHRPKR